MPAFDPSTHDDLIDIAINLATPATGQATFSVLAVLVADVTPGGGIFAEYSSLAEVTADIANLNATCQTIATKVFAQNPNSQENRPEKLVIIGVAVTASMQTYPEALDAAIAAGASFYGVTLDSRTEATQVALATDIENKADSGTYFLLGLQSDDSDWLTTGIPAAFSTAEGYERTIVYYHDDNGADAASDRLEVAHMAGRLAFDADVQAAGWNSTVWSVDDLATALTQTQKAFARANYANTALPLGTRTDTFVDPGKTLGGRPCDHIVAADWLRARTSEAVADLITSTSERGVKLTVDAQGQSLIGKEIEAVMQRGVAAGHFAAYNLTPLAITAADITAQRVRFDAQVQLTSGIRQVQIAIYADTAAIAA